MADSGPSRSILALLRGLVCAGALGCASCGGPSPSGTSAPSQTDVPRLRLEREGANGARLAGLSPLVGFARGRDCSLMHCLEVALEGLGRPISYDDLMGMSGHAFRLQVRADGWDAGAADPAVGDGCLDTLMAAVGWSYDFRVVLREDLTASDALLQAVRDSIDRRVPVLAANIMPPEDWGLIVGYRPDRTWLCRAYNDGAESVDRVAKGWPTGVILLTGARTRPASLQVHVDGVRRGIEMFERVRMSGAYVTGRKAFETWMGQLRAPRDASYVHANFWLYVNLIDSRAAAVRYLRDKARSFSSKEMHWSMAADWYDQEVRLLIQNLPYVPSAKEAGGSVPPYQTRQQQIDVLGQALKLEEKAVDSLKRAI